MAWGTRAAIAYSSLHTYRVISAVFSDASIGKADVEAQKAGLKDALALQDKSGIKRYAMPEGWNEHLNTCLLYTSPSPRDAHESRMPSSA